MPSLNPKTAFTIRPKADFTFRPKTITEAHGSVGVYRIGPKNQFVLRQRTGRLSQKGVAGAINRYYEQGGTRVGNIYIYARNSRVMQGTKNIVAAKIGDEKGWFTVEGRFISEDDFRNQLHSIDSTMVGQGYNEALVKKWDSLSPLQKAKVVDEFRNFNWDQFWTEFYPRFNLVTDKKSRIVRRRREGSETWETDNQFQMYDQIVERMAKALGEW